MNALSDLETGVEEEIRFGCSLPLLLIIHCAEERGWIEDMDDWDWTNGWEVDYWYKMIHSNKEGKRLSICGSLLMGNTSIEIEDEET